MGTENDNFFPLGMLSPVRMSKIKNCKQTCGTTWQQCHSVNLKRTLCCNDSKIAAAKCPGVNSSLLACKPCPMVPMYHVDSLNDGGA